MGSGNEISILVRIGLNKLVNWYLVMYAIVDIETTGGQASSSGITEVAILIHDGNKVVEKFHSLVNPEVNIPMFITSLTGITNEMVKDAPTFGELASAIYELLQPNVFVAHNVNFDYSFIASQLKYSGYHLKVKKLCTVRLSRRAFPGRKSYSLGNLCNDLKIPIYHRHRAMGDAEATALLFERIMVMTHHLVNLNQL